MSGPVPPGYVTPNYRTPRLFGIFNVLFGAQLIVCGLCLWGYVVSLPLTMRAMNGMQQQAVDRLEAQRKAQIDALIAKEKAAKNEEERKAAVAEREKVESVPKPTIPGMMDLTKLGMDDSRLIAWGWIDGITGVTLNVALLASGIGLMHWRRWGRTLCLWVASAKIVRLVLLQMYYIIALVPSMSEKMAGAVGDMFKNQPGMAPGASPPTQVLYSIYVTMYSAMGVGAIVLGVIYPALLLWYMTRPAVRVACSGMVKPPKEPNQP